jgi:hypothetical protein
MKARNVREASLDSLQGELDRLNELTRRLTHGERDLKSAVEGELKRRRKTANRQTAAAAK